MQYDISEIGAINVSLNFDEDWYNEWCNERKVADSPAMREEYAEEECDFDVEYFDSETFHHMGYDNMSYGEIVENFGEKLANDALSQCLADGKEHDFEIQAYQDDEIDVTNPQELNVAAVKYLRHGGYFKNCRGFILTNGVVVYTDSEHNQCSKIPGVSGTFHFIELGNIRVLDHGIDIAQNPTKEQYRVIEEFLESYLGETVYLDLMNKRIGNASKQYNDCDAESVMRDIYNYFERGIKPRENFRECRKITEKQLRKIIRESIINILNKNPQE